MMKVFVQDCMGTDLTVVNAARVSFAKKHNEFDSDKDEHLIKYLAKHNHWSPFGHCSCLLYTSPSPRDRQKSRMPSSA